MVQRSACCRSRRELSNAYLLAKCGFDTAENEPCKVCPIESCPADLLCEAERGGAHERGRVAEAADHVRLQVRGAEERPGLEIATPVEGRVCFRYYFLSSSVFLSYFSPLLFLEPRNGPRALGRSRKEE